jgi:hypothetical protein
MTYSLIANSTAVRRDADGATIPNDPNNYDWLAYQAWLAAGDTPTPVPSPTQAQLAASLVSAASLACAGVVAQVMPDPAHQAAFQNAASIVNGAGGAAPASGPMQTAFAALAAAYNTTPANFVGIVLAAQAASLTLGATLATLTGAANVATTPAALGTALSAFETALSGVVASLNAALPSPLIAPAAISIVGINA